MDEHAGVVRGAVRVAATTADALRLPEVLAAFHREHPGVRARACGTRRPARCSRCCAPAPSTSACSALADEAAEGLQVTRLFEEPLRAIAAPDEPFGAVVVGVEDLQGARSCSASRGARCARS